MDVKAEELGEQDKNLEKGDDEAEKKDQEEEADFSVSDEEKGRSFPDH